VGGAWCDTTNGIAWNLATDIVYRDDDERIMVPVGIEVWPLKMLALRLGKRFNHDTEGANLGLGVRLPPVSFDVSFVINNYSGDASLKWLLGLTYSLGAWGK
jgi:hypothetical protein